MPVTLAHSTPITSDAALTHRQCACGCLREFVASVLLCTRSVATNPAPRDFVTAAFAQQCLPQVPIRHRYPSGVHPSASDPDAQIFGHCSLNILRVGDDCNDARFLQG